MIGLESLDKVSTGLEASISGEPKNRFNFNWSYLSVQVPLRLTP